jgi:hypothetical protein
MQQYLSGRREMLPNVKNYSADGKWSKLMGKGGKKKFQKEGCVG